LLAIYGGTALCSRFSRTFVTVIRPTEYRPALIKPQRTQQRKVCVGATAALRRKGHGFGERRTEGREQKVARWK
jgi:hypothetical protein